MASTVGATFVLTSQSLASFSRSTTTSGCRRSRSRCQISCSVATSIANRMCSGSGSRRCLLFSPDVRDRSATALNLSFVSSIVTFRSWLLRVFASSTSLFKSLTNMCIVCVFKIICDAIVSMLGLHLETSSATKSLDCATNWLAVRTTIDELEELAYLC